METSLIINSNKNMKTKFKAVRPIRVTHPRGSEVLTNVVGEVIEAIGNRVYLKGPFYDFHITLKSFENYNVSSI